MSLPRIATRQEWAQARNALGRQEDWEETPGRAESARSAMPNFASYRRRFLQVGSRGQCPG
jgi:hypothetical protein